MSNDLQSWLRTQAILMVGQVIKVTSTAPAAVRGALTPAECDQALLAEVVKVYGLADLSALRPA